jgi:tetratricopeptide (TPR) repeat protein
MIRMARVFSRIPLILVLFVFFGAIPAQSQTSQDLLRQYVADLRKSPNDYALREKIIKHVQTMKPAPAIPEEARKYMDRGIAAVEGAKGEEDFRAASVEFTKAANLAPWLGDAYRNLAVAQDKSGQYDAALKNLRLYLLTAPPPTDEAWAKSFINKVEYRAEKAAKESSPEAITAKKQKEYEDWLKKLDGRRYTRAGSEELRGVTSVLDVKGKILVSGIILDSSSLLAGPRGYTEQGRGEIRGRVSEGLVFNSPDLPGGSLQFIYIISEEGDRITEQQRLGNGNTEERTFLWQR